MNQEDLKRGLGDFRARMKDAIPLDRIEHEILQALVQSIGSVLRELPNNLGRGTEAEIFEETLRRLEDLQS